ncbi:hypothetical protein GCM10011416_20080 [Polaribacter pacificus]|uniref:histidine kinase n=1 Tax=Polaribacter pacificus TaxID=1775173 RepID=A0A917I0R6_9FLAO|nr:ATP-binding protein [Polaribacter pacificus]GGH01349.1 hypothetical protein GCM10011416_20080 [Polaribacter pacificus]
MNLEKYKSLNSIFIWIILFFSSLVMLEWILKTKILFGIDGAGATTKFNTAFLFFLSALCLLFSKKKEKPFQILFSSLTLIIMAFSLLTIAEYIFNISLVDNLLVKDTVTPELPGRMSLATACSFTFVSTGFAGLLTKKIKYQRIAQHTILITSFITFLSIVTFVLRIPLENKLFFFKTMSIQTSIAFMLITFTLTFKYPKIGFTKMLLGNNYGSQTLRKSLPFTVLIPFLLSFILLSLINKGAIAVGFGILLYTMVLIFLSLLYFYYISVGMNKSQELRKHLEQNILLKNQELSQYKEALDKVAILAITDKNAIIKYVNEKFCSMSQYSMEEIIGKTDILVRSGYHPKSFHRNIIATVSSGIPWFGEVKNKKKDGTFYWTDTALIPFKDSNGNIYEYMAIKFDITERKNNEELLASKYVKTLEQKNKELEQFSYIASHDLQEPLRTITSFSDILYTEYYNKLDDQAKQIFTFIKEASGRMSNLIKNLLDYSRIGHQEELVKVDCNKLLNNINKDLTTLISETKTTIKISELPIITGYPTSIRLLFQNLISNAIKFSKKDEAPEITIGYTDKKDAWEFSIKDNGIGIQKEYQKKIFSIFQKLHAKEKYKGTGIGLAHCQKIVNLHLGEIWVKSNPNEGSTFYFTISKEII